MSDLQTISITVGILTACITVIIGVISFLKSNRRAEEQRQLTLEAQRQALETRQAELFMNIYNRWSSPEYAEAYRMARYEYTFPGVEEYLREVSDSAVGKTDPNLYVSIQTLATYFEGIGVLLKQNLINVELVEDLLAGRVIWFWENFGSSTANIVRERQNDPLLYDGMEYMYNQMKQRQQLPIVSS